MADWVELETTELLEKIEISPFLFFFEDDPFHALLHYCKGERIGRIVGDEGHYPCNICGTIIKNEAFIASAELLDCYIPKWPETDRMEVYYGHPVEPRCLDFYKAGLMEKGMGFTIRTMAGSTKAIIEPKVGEVKILDKIVYSGRVTPQIFDDATKAGYNMMTAAMLCRWVQRKDENQVKTLSHDNISPYFLNKLHTTPEGFRVVCREARADSLPGRPVILRWIVYVS